MAVQFLRLLCRATSRRRKQFAMLVCTVIFLSIFSTIQYVMTAILLNQWPTVERCRLASPSAMADEKAQSLIRASSYSSRHRSMGVVMPTVDYAAFKRLERNRAKSDDPDMVILARRSMMIPSDRLSLNDNSRKIKPSPLARIIEEITNKTEGFFVEYGAFKDKSSSGTVYLERVLGWSGLIIETDPYAYTQLVIERRSIWSLNGCLSNNSGAMEIQLTKSDHPEHKPTEVAKDAGPVEAPNSPSSASAPSSVATSAAGKNDALNVEVLDDNGQSSAICFPLETLLLALNKTHVDYISLTVKGFEHSILNTVPFDYLDIDVVLLHSPPSERRYDETMSRHGYRRYSNAGPRMPKIGTVFVKEHLLERRKKRVQVGGRDGERRNIAIVGDKTKNGVESPTNKTQLKPWSLSDIVPTQILRQNYTGVHSNTTIDSTPLKRQGRENVHLNGSDEYETKHKSVNQFIIYDTNG